MKKGYLLKMVCHISWEPSYPVKNFFIESENIETTILKRLLIRMAKGRNFTNTQIEELKKLGYGCDFKKSKESFGLWITEAVSIDGKVYELCKKVDEINLKEKSKQNHVK